MTRPVSGSIGQHVRHCLDHVTALLTADTLASGTHGRYNAIFLDVGDLSVGGGSAFTDAEWNALTSYEVEFGVRRVSLYTSPSASYGFASNDAGVDPASYDPQHPPAGLAAFALARAFQDKAPETPLPRRRLTHQTLEGRRRGQCKGIPKEERVGGFRLGCHAHAKFSRRAIGPDGSPVAVEEHGCTGHRLDQSRH
jgi:hypothetical protein